MKHQPLFACAAALLWALAGCTDTAGPQSAQGGGSGTGGAAIDGGAAGAAGSSPAAAGGGSAGSESLSGAAGVSGAAGMAGTTSGGAAGSAAASTGGASGVGGTAGVGGSGGAAGSGTGPASCQADGPGVSDCGDGTESCCKSVKVAGGSFSRTYANDGSGATAKADTATISDLLLDKYLVTVGRYRKFVAAWAGGSGYTPPVGSGKHAHLNGGKGLADSATAGAYETGWQESNNDDLSPTNDNLACKSDTASWTNSAGANEKLPINCVDWFEAYAFCIWDGGFLPSEAEFSYAAAGGDEQRQYPWGSMDPGKSNQYAIYGCNYPDGSGTCSGLANISPVGTAKLGGGRWGHLDLAGNLTEWNLDWYGATLGNPCADCANLTKASGRVIRGGTFSSGLPELVVPYRSSPNYPTNRTHTFGFRCARAP